MRTRSSYDIRGKVLTVMDPLNRVAFRYTYDFADRPWRIESIDAGLRRMVLNVLGNETERRDSKGALILQAYDRLQRPIRLWARDDASSAALMDIAEQGFRNSALGMAIDFKGSALGQAIGSLFD